MNSEKVREVVGSGVNFLTSSQYSILKIFTFKEK